MAFKLKNNKLKKIVKELKKASKMHASQADRIQAIAMESGSCGKPPGECECETNTLPGISPFAKKKKKGKKDACYHKVKSRVKVWPSAYASGQLVQCRKKGAANWGTGGKKKKS